MYLVRRIKELIGIRKPPIRHGHVYVDTITDETVEVKSVGRSVQIERQDAERRPDTTVRKKKMRSAIESGYVEHDEQRCPTCRDN